MRFTGGWIKIHRKLLSNDWSECLDAIGKGILLELLMTANVHPSRYTEGTEIKTLERGQLLIGLRKFADHLVIDRSTLMRRLEILRNMGTIAMESNHYGTKITICKYNEYQKNETDSEPLSNRQATDTPTPIEELKELKKEKKVPQPPLDQGWADLGTSWLNFSLAQLPSRSKDPKWNSEAFGRELWKVGKKMDLALPAMTALLEKIKGDDFWAKNAVSPFALLAKSKNGNRKIENILLFIDRASKPQTPRVSTPVYQNLSKKKRELQS